MLECLGMYENLERCLQPAPLFLIVQPNSNEPHEHAGGLCLGLCLDQSRKQGSREPGCNRVLSRAGQDLFDR